MILIYLLGCSHPEDSRDSGGLQPFYAPSERGPYQAATEKYEAESRHGFILPVQAWFPAADPSDDPFPYLGTVSGSAVEDSDPDCSQSRPVVVFSHGNGGIGYQSFFLAEHLASHGYVVAAPDHVGNTLFSLEEDRMPELVFRRPQDVSDTFDWLLSEPGFSGCADPGGGYAVIGHSFGGYTAFAVAGAAIDAAATEEWCASNGGWLCGEVAAWEAQAGEGRYELGDSRAWAGVPLAPAGYEALVGGLADILVPMAVIGGDADDITSMAESVIPLYSGLASPRGLGTLKGAGHYAFSDMCTILPTFSECVEDGFLPVEDAHPLINTSVTAFLGMVRGLDGMKSHLPPDSPLLDWMSEGLD